MLSPLLHQQTPAKCVKRGPSLAAIRIKKQVRTWSAHNPDRPGPKGSFTWEEGGGKKDAIIPLPWVLIPAVPHPGQVPPDTCFCL